MDTTKSNALLAFLMNDRVFSGVFNGDSMLLIESAAIGKARRRDVLYRPGDAAESVYWIKSGRVKLYKLTEDGREIIHAMYQAGDIFGEMAFFENRPRECFAEALEDLQYAVIRKRDLMALAKRKPIIIYRMAKLIGERRREAEREKEILMMKGVKERLAGLLLRLGETYGVEDSRGRLLKVKITHKDLASLVGSSRETVTLVLCELRRMGVLAQNPDRKIIIRDQERLLSMS